MHATFNVKTLRTFVLPRSFKQAGADTDRHISICAIIPSFMPDILTLRLVQDILKWNPQTHIYVVDDSTPYSAEESHSIFKQIAKLSKRVTLLRTPKNKLKAGAINYALTHIKKNGDIPSAIITLDDDVVIEEHSIPNMLYSLFADKQIGAVCSQSRVLNKNKNILTRLQGLEYLGFNAVRIADEGFFHGPLVMHGMLTAFKKEALYGVNGFTENHLIEDYEITTRVKEHGWDVRLAADAYAWTRVPETFSKLWKQRTRWIYGGVVIMDDVKYWPSVIQDITGHFIFLITLLLIAVFTIIPFNFGLEPISPVVIKIIIGLSLMQAAIMYGFQMWFMRFYDERDVYDWLLRATFIPEFIYANVLTLVLLGAYLFHLFNWGCTLFSKGLEENIITKRIRAAFHQFGYTNRWNTRENFKHI